MPKYQIMFQAIVSDFFEIEAEDKQEAIDKVYELGYLDDQDVLPYELMDTRNHYYSVGEWYVEDEERDVEEID